VTSRPSWIANLTRAAAVAAAVGGFFFISSRLQPPARGTEYDKSLDTALEQQQQAMTARPHPNFPDYIRDPVAGKRKANELILKSKGDFNRLDDDEQSWLNSVTAGHGMVMVRKTYAEVAAQAKREQQASGKPQK
jgi:hypothetical protein